MQLGTAKTCIVRASVFLAIILVTALSLFSVLQKAFLYNVYINSVILFSLVSGVVFIYKKLFMLDGEFAKLVDFDKMTKREAQKLTIVNPIVMNLAQNGDLFSQSKIQTVMASVEKRVASNTYFPRYLSGVLVFMGLLGTFWGLSHTISNVANIIENLGMDSGGSKDYLFELKQSLKIPLAGMGVAFGCSLFGLTSSLVIGFLNVQLHRVAEDFLIKAEEWLAHRVVNMDSVEKNLTYHGEVFSMALLEKTIETIYAFQGQLNEFEGNRTSIIVALKDLTQKLAKFAEAQTTSQDIVKTLIKNQVELQNLTASMFKQDNENVWREILKKLHSIDGTLTGLTQETLNCRHYIVENLGKEVRMVTKTLSSMIRDR
ncbi:MAG: hypothetical protein LBF56_03480 [Holosporales bacterium]|jgi:biopolymer transport protein ExbB/TolQ|nr:hypothetical protein [Holosporales bacterium]